MLILANIWNHTQTHDMLKHSFLSLKIYKNKSPHNKRKKNNDCLLQADYLLSASKPRLNCAPVVYQLPAASEIKLNFKLKMSASVPLYNAIKRILIAFGRSEFIWINACIYVPFFFLLNVWKQKAFHLKENIGFIHCSLIWKWNFIFLKRF